MSTKSLRRVFAESVSGLPREFWWLWTSTLVNRLGAFVATFLALYLTVERGYSASYAGLIGALYGFGSVVASIVAGVTTDRLGRRPTLLIAQTSTAVSVAALGFVTHPLAIAVLAWTVGFATNASRPAVQAMIADIVPAPDRVRAFSLNYWAINMGFAVSSAGAGLLAQYSYQLLFVGEAVMVLACALVVFTKLPESRPRSPRSEGPTHGSARAAGRAEERISLWQVLRDGRFMTVVGLSLIIATLIQQAFVALPVSMGTEGFSSSDFGQVIAMNGVLIVLLQLPLTRIVERQRPARVLVVSALLVGYGFGMHAFAGSVGFYVLAVCVWTLGEMINAPTQMGLVVRLSPAHGRGRYQGMYTLSWSLATLLAPLLGGGVIDRYGADTLWAASAVLGSVAALGYGLLLRTLPAESAEEPTANQPTADQPTTDQPSADQPPADEVAPSDGAILEKQRVAELSG